MELKYLFGVQYKNGETYFQNKEDTSISEEGRKLNKSAFFDILLDEVHKFWIYDSHNTYTVNLFDGSFEVNGNRFYMHEKNYSEYRLIFFRRHIDQFLVDDGGFYDGAKISEKTMYCIGWQATEEEKNEKRIMMIE